MIHGEGYSFRELRGGDGLGWVGRDGVDVAATGARELSREDNLALAAAICNGLNSDAESTWLLDQAWGGINSLGRTFLEQDLVARGYCEAVSACLSVIEKLGGMDPLQRNLDPRTPEFGVAP